MKLTKLISLQEINAENLISKLVMLESKDLAKKKKRKSINRTQDLISETTSSKRPKLESKETNALVHSPIRVKSEDVLNQNQESSSKDDQKLPTPISIKKEQNKRISTKSTKIRDKEVQLSCNEKTVVKQISYFKQNLRSSDSSEEDESVLKPKQHEKGDVSDPKRSSKNFGPFPEIKQKTTAFGERSLIQNNTNTSSSDSESSRDKGPTGKPNWIQTVQLRNSGWKKQIVDLNSLEPDAKYSLIRVPKTIDPALLQNLKCSFDHEVYVTLNNKQYLFQPLEKKPEPIFVNANDSRLVNLEKVIVLQKSVPSLPFNNITVPERKIVSLPDTVQTRHPLFGVDYKRRISIKKKIKKKIHEAIENKAKLEKRERKRKRSMKIQGNLVNDEKSILDILPNLRPN